MAGSNNMQMDSLMTRLNSLRKISCDQAGKGDQYNCKVEIDLTAPLIGHRKSVTQLNLIKDKDGWDVVQ